MRRYSIRWPDVLLERYIIQWPEVVFPASSYKCWWEETKWRRWRARFRMAASNGAGRSDFTGWRGDK